MDLICLWRPAYTPGRRSDQLGVLQQHCTVHVQCLYISCYVTVNKPVLSYLLSRLRPVESLQSHMILTMSHWSSGLTCLLPATRVIGSNPLEGLVWNRDSPVSIVSLHWWPRRDWSSTGLSPQLSLGPHTNNVTVPLDLTQPSCPGFTLAAGLPSGFTTGRVGCLGGALWRACNLTWFSPCLTGPVD